ALGLAPRRRRRGCRGRRGGAAGRAAPGAPGRPGAAGAGRAPAAALHHRSEDARRARSRRARLRERRQGAGGGVRAVAAAPRSGAGAALGRDLDPGARAARGIAGRGRRRRERAHAGPRRICRVPARTARRGAGRGGESVIRAVLVATLCFAPAAVHARPHRLQVEVPEIELPDLGVDLHALLAKSAPRYPDRDDPEFDFDVEDDTGNDSADDEVETDGKAKVYKLNPQRVRIPRIHVGGDDHDFDEREATAQAKGKGSATLEVKGPVTLQLRAQAGEVEVVATDKRQVSVTLTDAPPDEIVLSAFGDRVEPSFRGRRTLRRGKLHVELPRGSRLDLSSMSGDVSAQRIGDVRVRTMSGDVKLSGVGKVDVQSISGDTKIEDAAGPVRLHTV